MSWLKRLLIISISATFIPIVASSEVLDSEILDEIGIIEKEQAKETRRIKRIKRARKQKAKERALKRQLVRERAKRLRLEKQRRAQMAQLKKMEQENERDEAIIQAQRQRAIRKAKRQRTAKRRRYKDLAANTRSNSYNQIPDHKSYRDDDRLLPRLAVHENTRGLVPQRRKKRLGWGIYSYYSAPNTLKSTTNSYYNTNNSAENLPDGVINGEFASESSFGIGAEFAMPKLVYLGPLNLGFNTGLSYEFGRSIDRIYRGYNYAPTAKSPSLSLILPYLNVMAGYKSFYTYGGVNYSFPRMKEGDDELFTGDLGFQAAIGYEITDWISAEVVHRWVKFNASSTLNNNGFVTASDNTFERSGLGITEDETLQLNGFLLNLKILF